MCSAELTDGNTDRLVLPNFVRNLREQHLIMIHHPHLTTPPAGAIGKRHSTSGIVDESSVWEAQVWLLMRGPDPQFMASSWEAQAKLSTVALETIMWPQNSVTCRPNVCHVGGVYRPVSFA